MRRRRASKDSDDLIGDPNFKPISRIDDLIPRRSRRAKSRTKEKPIGNLPRVIGPSPSDFPKDDERYLVGIFWLQTRFRAGAKTVRNYLSSINYARTYRQGSNLWELIDAAPKLMRGRFAHLSPEAIQQVFDEDKRMAAPRLENAIWGANLKRQGFASEARKLYRVEKIETVVRNYYKVFACCVDRAIEEIEETDLDDDHKKAARNTLEMAREELRRDLAAMQFGDEAGK